MVDDGFFCLRKRGMFTKPVPLSKTAASLRNQCQSQNRPPVYETSTTFPNRRQFTKQIPLSQTATSLRNKYLFPKPPPVSKTNVSPLPPITPPKHSPQPNAASSFLSACWNFPSCQKEKIPPVPRWPPSLKCPDFPKEH